MKIESLATQLANTESMRSVSRLSEQQIRQVRDFKQHDMSGHTPESKGAGPDENKVSPEEILDKIKEISEDGLYSVRFEKNEDIDQLVVKLVDRQTDEVIRQIPPETLLGVKANLQAYSGNIVNQVS